MEGIVSKFSFIIIIIIMTTTTIKINRIGKKVWPCGGSKTWPTWIEHEYESKNMKLVRIKAK